MSDTVLVEKVDQAAIVTLNRPEAMNALSAELMKRLTQVFKDLRKDESVRAVILTGAGRAFCAGLDLKDMADGGFAQFDIDPKDDHIVAMHNFGRPIIGAINGAAATGGFETALACDMLIASPKARFFDTHARVGVLSGWGMSQKLQRIIGANRAREISFTGNPLSAEKAERWGLVNRIVAEEDLLPTCLQLAADMASADQRTLVAYKRLINEGGGLSLRDSLEFERFSSDLFGMLNAGTDFSDRPDTVIKRNRAQD